MDGTPTLIAAIGAGALSCFSAAVVPLIPACAACTWTRRAASVVLFLLAHSVVLVGLGAGATAAGQALLEHLALLEGVAGVGLLTIGVREMRTRAETRSAGTLAVALAAGAALTFGWTPLAGEVLNQILAIASSTASVERGVLLLAAYALGRALPLLALALALGAIHRMLSPDASRRVQLVSGAVIALTGMLIAAGLLPPIAASLMPVLPLA